MICEAGTSARPPPCPRRGVAAASTPIDTSCWATEGERAACRDCTAVPTTPPGCCGWRPHRLLPLLATRQTEAFIIQGSLRSFNRRAARTRLVAPATGFYGGVARWCARRYRVPQKHDTPYRHRLEPHAADLHDLYAHRHPRWGPRRPAGSPCSASPGIHDFVLLEARSALGGRITSSKARPLTHPQRLRCTALTWARAGTGPTFSPTCTR